MFHSQGATFRFDHEQILLVFAMGLRLASALAGVYERPVDLQLLKAGLGLASFIDFERYQEPMVPEEGPADLGGSGRQPFRVQW